MSAAGGSKAKLRSGYTTGTHATAALAGALLARFGERRPERVEVALPSGERVWIDIEVLISSGALSVCRSFKTDNDDPDVTKGCEIVVRLAERYESLLLAGREQEPHVMTCGAGALRLYAGEGVGVATRAGIKVPLRHPAVNPTPLAMMREALEPYAAHFSRTLYASLGILHGETLAKSTANAKVGVLGGLSILGSTGVVKPISHESFLESIRTEIAVADAAACESVAFTLGNTAKRAALKGFAEVQVVEVGNAVEESVRLLDGFGTRELVFYAGPGKMAKIAQGFKNTHNRYGDIDFTRLGAWLRELGIGLDLEEATTVRGVLERLDENGGERVRAMLCARARTQLISYAKAGLEVRTVMAEG